LLQQHTEEKAVQPAPKASPKSTPRPLGSPAPDAAAAAAAAPAASAPPRKLGTGEKYVGDVASAPELPIEVYETRFKNIEFIEKLGGSTFGESWRAGYINGVPATLKRWKVLRGEQVDGLFKSAVEIAMDLKHPHLLPIIGASCDKALITLWRYVDTPSLRGLLSHPNASSYNDEWVLIVLRQIVSAMQYLHSRGLVHRSLHTANVFLDSENKVQLRDYGFAEFKDRAHSSDPDEGSAMAPEVISGQAKNYTEKVDVFSFGLLMWELITKKKPFQGLDDREIAIEISVNQTRPPIPPGCPVVFEKLMRACWTQDPKDRPTFEYIHRILDKPNAVLLAHSAGDRASVAHAVAATGDLKQDKDKLQVLAEKLADMLQSVLELEVANACKTIQALAKIEGTAAYLCERGIIELVERHLSTEDDRAREEAIRALGALCEDAHCNEFISRREMLAPLVDQLKSAKLTELGRVIIIKTLASAAKHETGKIALGTLGMLPLAVDLIDSSENVQAQALDLVAQLVRDSAANQRLLHGSGSLRKLIGHLSSSNLAILTRVMCGLGNMAFYKPAVAELQNAGVFGKFHSFLSSRAQLLQGIALEYTTSFAENETLRPILVSVGVVPALVSLVTSTKPSIRIAALRALSHLLVDPATQSAVTGSSTLIEYVSLAVEAEDRLVQIAGLRLAALLAEHRSLDAEIRRNGWPVQFLSLARRANQITRDEVVIAVAPLSNNKEFAAQMSPSNLVGLLVQSIRSSKPHVRERALYTVANICTNLAVQGAVLEAGVLPVLLSLEEDSDAIKSLTVKALLALSVNAPNRESMRGAGAREKLSKLSSSQNPAIREATAKAINFLDQ
jgi:hypothetical protein